VKPDSTATHLQQNPRQTYLDIWTCSLRRLQESVPAHEALHLAVNTRAGHRPDDRPDWKRPRGRPRHTLDPPASWGLTSGSLQMLLGTWPVIVMSGGRNDPSLAKRSNE